MRLRGQVQPVRRPGVELAQEPHRPQVDQVAAAGVGDRAQVHVVGRDPAPQQPHDREPDQVGPGEQEHPAAGRAEPGDRAVEDLGQRVRVTAGADDVVAAGRQ